jgi:hypothetical protein
LFISGKGDEGRFIIKRSEVSEEILGIGVINSLLCNTLRTNGTAAGNVAYVHLEVSVEIVM